MNHEVQHCHDVEIFIVSWLHAVARGPVRCYHSEPPLVFKLFSQALQVYTAPFGNPVTIRATCHGVYKALHHCSKARLIWSPVKLQACMGRQWRGRW